MNTNKKHLLLRKIFFWVWSSKKFLNHQDNMSSLCISMSESSTVNTCKFLLWFDYILSLKFFQFDIVDLILSIFDLKPDFEDQFCRSVMEIKFIDPSLSSNFDEHFDILSLKFCQSDIVDLILSILCMKPDFGDQFCLAILSNIF